MNWKFDIMSRMTDEEKQKYFRLMNSLDLNGDVIHDSKEFDKMIGFYDTVNARIALGRKPTSMELLEYRRNRRIHDRFMDKNHPLTMREEELIKTLGENDIRNKKLIDSDGESYRTLGGGLSSFRNNPEEMRKLLRKKKSAKPKSKRCKCK